jgi:hypothetical protein
MAAIGDEVIALRAQVLRLKELMASKGEVIASKNEVIASKTAQLSSKDAQLLCKDEVIATKVESTALLSRTVEELQQYKSLSVSKPIDAAADSRLDSEPPSSKRQRWYINCSSSSAEIASPLDKDEILDQIFSYVGGGDHLYIGGVNRRWRGRYLQYCARNSTSKCNRKLVTRQRSVLLSASRLQLAISNGLAVEGWTFEGWSHAELVCKHSLEPQQVMALLRLHGVPWSATLCEVAASLSKLSLLQWLRASSCPWQESYVLGQACMRGGVAMLEWIRTVVPPWSAARKRKMLNGAGWSDNLAVSKWIKAQGAEWPSKFIGTGISTGTGTASVQCWSLTTVKWAIASGSRWLDWLCEDYVADKYTESDAKQHAVDVLKWAHANGCPCTCGHQQQQQQ